MKSARALVPILIVVLLVCTMALTFAWFAQTMEEVKVGNAFTIGDTNYVYLTDGELPEGAPQTTIQATLIGERYNGELGFKEDGEPYPSDNPDASYHADYVLGVLMNGDGDMTLSVQMDGLTVRLSRYATGVTTQRLWDSVFSELTDGEGVQIFPDITALDGHIGTAAQQDGEWQLTDPEGTDEVYLYTTDGTSDGKPAALRLNKNMTEQLFRISLARSQAQKPQGEFGSSVTFSYAAGEVKRALSECPEHELLLRIEFGYADENDKGIPFPFADEAFRGCKFGFEVTASAQ